MSASGMLFQCDNRDSIIQLQLMPSIKQRTSSTDIQDTQLDHKHGKYAMVSREGVFTTTSFNLDQTSIHRVYPSPPHASIWITDMIYMPREHIVALTTTGREIIFIDITNDKFRKIARVTQLEACPTSMCFWTHNYTNKNSVLLWGDDNGGVSFIIFEKLLTATALHPKNKMGRSRFGFGEILAGKVKYLTGHWLRGIHAEPVLQVKYWQHLGCFVSCAKDNNTAMYLGDIERKLVTSHFKVFKGINSFDICSNLNVIASGGFDALVRVWNPYVPATPILLLRGHKSPIMSVHINSVKEHIISVGENKEVRIHDLNTQTCIQTLYKNALLAFGTRPISGSLFNPARGALMLATTVAGVFEHREEDIKSLVLTTHVKPVTVALYNPLFKQVVSAATDSQVCVWNIFSGEKVMQFTAHASRINGRFVKAEVTTMTFDPTFRRLITAGRDGTVKVWNFNNGAMLREIPTTDNHHVAALVCPEQRIMTGGWNKKMTVYIDDVDDDSFRDILPHCIDDIHTLALYQPSIVAAGTNAGDILFWSLDTNRPILWLDTTSRKPYGALKLKKFILEGKQKALHGETTSVGGLPNLKSHQKGHTNQQGQTNPQGLTIERCPINQQSDPQNTKPHLFKTQGVCKLVFLDKRSVDADTGILVAACDSGYIQFWSICQNARMLGEFFAAHAPGQSVTSMVVSEDNEMIVNADSLGYLKVWDISHYCVAGLFCNTELDEQRSAIWKRFPFSRLDSPSKKRNADNPNAPPLINSFRAHIYSISCVDLVFLRGRYFVITSSADCSVRLFTIEGRFQGIFGQKAHWANVKRLFEENFKDSYQSRLMPPDIRRVASATTLRVYKETPHPMWFRAKTIFSWISRCQPSRPATTVKPCKPVMTAMTSQEEGGGEVEGEVEVDVGVERWRNRGILGQSYKRSTRHRPLPGLPSPTMHNSNKCLAFSSLPYAELDESVRTDVILKDETLREIQTKYRLPPLLRKPERRLNRKVKKLIIARRMCRINK